MSFNFKLILEMQTLNSCCPWPFFRLGKEWIKIANRLKMMKNFFHFIVFFMVQRLSESHFKKANSQGQPVPLVQSQQRTVFVTVHLRNVAGITAVSYSEIGLNVCFPHRQDEILGRRALCFSFRPSSSPSLPLERPLSPFALLDQT